MSRLRRSGPFNLTVLLAATLSLQAHAQSPSGQSAAASPPQTTTTQPISTHFDAVDSAADKLPDAPAPPIAGQQTADQHSGGSISGTVLDANGAEIAGATVALDNSDSKVERTLTTDSKGAFNFDGIEPGRFTLAITSAGFTTWTSTDLPLHAGQSYELPLITLQVALAMTDVEVTFTRHDIAEDEIHLEEKQRVLGVFPNFFVSYVKDPAPLSSGQKFRLALRMAADPVSIAIPAVIAGVEQSQNDFSGYGQGAQGYAKRFGASSADSLISTMIGDAILPSILRQDPRYFYKGVGSIRSRALYAISAVVICKGDNGHWQPNYSNVLGNLASASISNLYYPSTNRDGVQLTVENWLVGTASGAIGTLFQEFLVKKISRGVQHQAGP